MTEQQQSATAGSVALESDPIVEQAVVEIPEGTGTPETVAETDDEKNTRELQEQKERSEKKARGVQKRLDELTADKYEARERAAQAERRESELRRQVEELSRRAQPAADANPEPTRDQFNDYETFLRAQAKWEARNEALSAVEQRLAAERQAAQYAYARHNAEQVAQTLQRDLAAKQTAYAKTVPDYFDVVQNDEVTVPEIAAIAIMRHPDAPAIMYHLGKNPALAESLQGLDNYAQAAAVGELAATIKRIPQVSKAPPPGTPVGARSSGQRDLRSMSADEYYAHITKGRGGKK